MPGTKFQDPSLRSQGSSSNTSHVTRMQKLTVLSGQARRVMTRRAEIDSLKLSSSKSNSCRAEMFTCSAISNTPAELIGPTKGLHKSIPFSIKCMILDIIIHRYEYLEIKPPRFIVL